MKAIPAHRAILLAVCAAAGCSGGGNGSAGGSAGASTGVNGNLTLQLADAPATDASEIWIQITNVSLKPAGDGAAIDFPLNPPRLVDLMSLKTPADAVTLLDGVDVPAGRYNWLAMDVASKFDGSTADGYVLTKSGTEQELNVPSGRVRLVSGLTITADQATQFLVDWNAHMGLVRPPGHGGGYMLRPAFRVVDMTQYGTLSGTVATSTITDANNNCQADDAGDLGVGNLVYVYAGKGVTPDDIDGNAPDPVATLEVAQNQAGDYAYKALLSPGDYTVAFTCQAGNDNPDTDDTTGDPATDKVNFSAGVDVTIDTGKESTVNF